MAKDTRQDSFWTSYADLMTSLFFIMLVLFVICIIQVSKKNIEINKELGDIRIKHNDKAIDVIDNFGTSDKEGYEEYMNMDSTIAIIRGVLEVLMGEDILNVAKDLRFHNITLDDMKTILVINEDGTFDKEKSFLNARNIIEVMGEFI